MGEIIRPELQPVILQIGSNQLVCEPGLTETHIYRKPEDTVFNHIEVVTSENGLDRQRLYAFDCLDYIMYLSGIPMPGTDFNKKEIKKITTQMEEEVGWNARVILDEEAPDSIKDRYVRVASRAVRQEVVVVPGDWK